MTPQELKNSILQLAIQGKLVEQRAEEGTGAELLEKILAAKNAEGAKGREIKLTRSRGVRGGSEDEGISNLPKAAKSHHGKLSASPREEIPDDEKPFDIPESWEWVRLGEIGSWASGATPSRTHSEYYGGSIPWLKTGDLTDGYVSSIPEFITDLALGKNSVRLNPIGSVLMAMYGATIGKLGILQIAATTNQACCACIPYDGVWNKYLFYYLMARRKAFIKMGEGGAQPNISKEKIVNALIPLPPLAEQKRIVAKIEELMPLVDRYEKAWSRLEDFNKRFPADMQKSLLQMAIQGKLVEQRAEEGTGAELLEKILAAKNVEGAKGREIKLTRSRGVRGGSEDEGISNLPKAAKSHHGKLSALSASPREEIPDDEKPFDIPESWEWVRLGEIFVTSSGTTPLKSNADYYSNQDYNWVRTTDLNNGILTSCEIKISRKAFEECRLSVIPIDSVCVAMYGGAGTIGKNAIIKFDTTINQSVCAIQPNGFCDMSFVQKFLQVYRPFWMKMAAGSRKDPNINQVIIKNALFPLPPLAEQKRIVAKLEELLPLCERLK